MDIKDNQSDIEYLLTSVHLRFLVAKGVNPGLQDEVVSLVLPDEKFTIFASLGVQKNSEFAGLFDYGLMKQAETGTQRKVFICSGSRNV